MAVSIENWTNQKLEFPSLTQEEGGTDRWYPPQDIPKHTRLVLIPILDLASHLYPCPPSLGQQRVILIIVCLPPSLSPCFSSQFYCVRLKGSSLFPQLILFLCKISNSNLLPSIPVDLVSLTSPHSTSHLI